MSADRSNFFAGPYLDRRAQDREAEDWQAQALADSTAQYLVARGTTQLMRLTSEPSIAFLSGDHPRVRTAPDRRMVLLGGFQGRRCILLELDTDEKLDPAPAGAIFEELRPVMNLLPADEAALAAYARALTLWRSRHHFCGVCGRPTVPVRAGHVLRCTNPVCAHETFPRIDPAIIVLISDGERALLGRQASWPAGRYSTLAGFVEPGESLEDAVAREVLEETGVAVHDIHYRSSQPWPFPSSLMLGFQAKASPGAPVQIGNELEHARWFTRAELISGKVPLPPSRAISYRLIHEWLHPRGT